MTKINKSIKNVVLKDYPSTNLETVEFELHGMQYYANHSYNNNGETVECIYGRIMKNEYYDIIDTINGGTNGMEQKTIKCVFGDMPIETFELIRAIKN